ncbi:DUF4292 domain-containing protein [Rhodothermus profundi]|uniref:DUF4292 domain-containing protein n=1 Tax=Rhodothermus profundi TaxID=633813 RepID=A0A1M6WT81_9BACT|nr:DUF4292 domain-containing protein [Rhodothermus profundi]SHK96876.1 protein of unknown function [Rhodothermus profundi]
MRLVFLLVSAVLFLSGCARGPRLTERPALPDQFPYHSAEQICYQLRLPADTIHAFTGRARLQVRTPAGTDNLSITIVARRNDSLLIRLSPGWGIEAARLLITPDSVLLHDRVHHRLYAGTRTEQAVRHLPLPAGRDPFLSLLGILYPSSGFWHVTADSGYYYLQDPSRQQRYIVDPTRWRVVRYERYTPTGILVEVYRFEAFSRFGSIFLPRRIHFERPDLGMTVRLYYRTLQLNPPNLQFVWNPDARLRRLPFQAMLEQP